MRFLAHTDIGESDEENQLNDCIQKKKLIDKFTLKVVEENFNSKTLI